MVGGERRSPQAIELYGRNNGDPRVLPDGLELRPPPARLSRLVGGSGGTERCKHSIGGSPIGVDIEQIDRREHSQTVAWVGF
jgi:hypothetical protein